MKETLKLVIFKGLTYDGDESLIIASKSEKVVLIKKENQTYEEFEQESKEWLHKNYSICPCSSFQSPGDFPRHWIKYLGSGSEETNVFDSPQTCIGEWYLMADIR